jgi:hypothetical protein
MRSISPINSSAPARLSLNNAYLGPSAAPSPLATPINGPAYRVLSNPSPINNPINSAAIAQRSAQIAGRSAQIAGGVGWTPVQTPPLSSALSGGIRPPLGTTAPTVRPYVPPRLSTPVNLSPAAIPTTVSAPIAAPPVVKSFGSLVPVLGAIAMLPQLLDAIGDAAGDTRKLAGLAYAAGRDRDRANLAVALAILPTAPFAVAGLAAGSGRPAGIPSWAWPFPDPPAPNTLDPAAMDEGAIVTVAIPPPFTGGQKNEVYVTTIRATGSSGTGPVGGNFLRRVRGPIGGVRIVESASSATVEILSTNINVSSSICGSLAESTYTWRPIGVGGSAYRAENGGSAQILGNQICSGVDDGGDPAGAVDPVRVLNPARQTSTPAAPRTLPPPLPQPSAGDLPWPETAPQTIPDTAPLAPPAPVPSTFRPTPTPEPLPPTTPGVTPAPTDLLAPRETPPNLGTDPLTPPVSDPLTPVDEAKPTGWLVNGKPSNVWGSGAPIVRVNGEVQNFPSTRPSINSTTSALEVALPIALLAGTSQPLKTPTVNLNNPTAPNPAINVVSPPIVPTPPTTGQPTVCLYEQQRVMDIQTKATDTQQRASNPVSGFPGLYGIGIESRVKLGQTFDLLGNVNQFMRKAWEMTRMQKILDVLTFVGVMHNVSMLSRDVGETFLEVVGQGLQAIGIRDEENQVIDVNEVVGQNVEGLLKNILGVERYNGINEAWNKANRIISSASAIIWTVRSIADASQDLMEWIGENTGRIGNALKRWRVVGEDAYPDMSESAKAQHRMRSRFNKFTGAAENAEDRISVFGQATSNVIEIQEETNELAQNFGQFRESVVNGIPDPWADNAPVKEANDQAKADSLAPNIEVSDSQKG